MASSHTHTHAHTRTHTHTHAHTHTHTHTDLGCCGGDGLLLPILSANPRKTNIGGSARGSPLPTPYDTVDARARGFGASRGRLVLVAGSLTDARDTFGAFGFDTAVHRAGPCCRRALAAARGRRAGATTYRRWPRAAKTAARPPRRPRGCAARGGADCVLLAFCRLPRPQPAGYPPGRLRPPAGAERVDGSVRTGAGAGGRSEAPCASCAAASWATC